MKIVTCLAFALATSAISSAAVIINSTTGNGGFAGGTNSFKNTVAGWSSGATNFYHFAGDSPLTSAPYGADSGAGAIVLSSAGSEYTFFSTTFFNVAVGDVVNFSFDLTRNSAGASDVDILIQNVTSGTFTNIGHIGGILSPAFTQFDFSSAALGGQSNLRVVINQHAGSSASLFDRVHLETTPAPVPEASSALLGCIGALALLRRRR